MRRQVIYMLLLSLAILVGVAAITQWSSREVDAAREQIERSLMVNEQLELYLSYTKDVETSIRGYALSGNPAFLETSQAAIPQLTAVQHRLESAIQDSEQRQRLPLLVELANKRLKLANRFQESTPRNTARTLVIEGKGKTAMDALRNHVDQMHHYEMVVLNRAKQRARRAVILDHWVVSLGFLVIILLQCGAFMILNREMLERQATNDQLARINHELETFSYSVSHDLRSPLRSISGFSQALLNHKADQLDDEGKDFLERIRINAQRMGTLIDDLLQLSRLSRAELTKQTLDLGALAHDIAADLRQNDPERHVTITIEPDLVVSGDSQLLHAALENLMNNAWKYTSKTDHPEITVGKTTVKEQPVFFVRDNGAGFDMQYAHKLFGAFQRLHAMEEFSGNGIGLATVQRIIHRHGGSVWAEGELNKGATFFFTL